MRVRALVTIAVLLSLLSAPAPAGAVTNPQTAGLQVALQARGLYDGPIDAVLGPATARAVRVFQRRAGLVVDGLAGSQTRAKLGKLGRPTFGRRTIKRGAVGWDVSVLQFLLTQRRQSPGAIDGRFGAQTEKALRGYQRSVLLRADGIAGPRTIAALSLQERVPVRSRARVHRRYVVRAGDTLTAIAARHGTTIRVLARANRLDPQRVLLIGARLRVPTAPPTATIEDPFAVRLSLARWSSHYGVDPSLARGLAWMESGFQPNVVSSVGATGVMQLLPETWEFVETVLVGRTIPRTTDGNIRAGLAYLRHLLREFRGDERLALAAWYQGPAAVRKRGLYAETKTFVANVLALKQRM